MKKIVLMLLLMMATQITPAQEWITPVIDGYGKITELNDAAAQPNASMDYKIVFDVKDDRELDGINIGLFKIARMINLLGVGGINPEKIHMVAAIHGGATFAVLNEAKYQEKNKKPNPNTEVLQLLKDYGVELLVCGQATASRRIAKEDLNPNVEVATSAMMVLANYQLQGYVIMP